MSNSAGSDQDVNDKEANLLEEATGVKVLRHSLRKPFCGPQILDYLFNAPDSNVTSPSQVAVVGDRILTDVLMANSMGSWSIYVKNGVVTEKDWVGFVTRLINIDSDMHTD